MSSAEFKHNVCLCTRNLLRASFNYCKTASMFGWRNQSVYFHSPSLSIFICYDISVWIPPSNTADFPFRFTPYVPLFTPRLLSPLRTALSFTKYLCTPLICSAGWILETGSFMFGCNSFSIQELWGYYSAQKLQWMFKLMKYRTLTPEMGQKLAALCFRQMHNICWCK